MKLPGGSKVCIVLDQFVTNCCDTACCKLNMASGFPLDPPGNFMEPWFSGEVSSNLMEA